MLTIENPYAAMYLENAARNTVAAELGDALHTRAVRANRRKPGSVSTARERAHWDLYYAARTERDRQISKARDEGVLLHYGCKRAEQRAVELEEERQRARRAA